MNAVKTLPTNYIRTGSIDLSKRKTAIILNLVGLAFLFLFGWIFARLATTIRPDIGRTNLLQIVNEAGLVATLGSLALVLIFHEFIHGFFFWMFTGERPKIGIHLVYAYAAAPDWYLPRNQFIVVGLAPFVVITTVGLLLLPFVSEGLVNVLLVALIFNGAGSLGDFIVVGWLIAKSDDILAQDLGSKFIMFEPVQENVAELGRRWIELMESLGIDGDAARDARKGLVNHYNEDGRYYHSLKHVGTLLEIADGLQDLTHDFVTVELAIWFHDVIYDPHRSDNEARSAKYAQETLEQLGLSPSIVERVVELVKATTDHQPAGDVDTQILIDVDLSPLGADEAIYDRDAKDIRKEYHWIPEAEYRATRARNLGAFLERDRLFQIDILYEEREKRARRNISREIASLTGADLQKRA